MKIEVLSDQLINQIAAGEVVERPASVVKELVENSIDALSRHIAVRIEEGGLQSIEIEDDGEGMTAEELPQAFLRHATSKIRREEDLHDLHTLGFRGEALPSIASVSKVEIYSATASGSGSFARLEGGKIVTTGPWPAANGTRILVKELFWNTPARRKFMKSSTTEFHKVHDLMVKQALSRTDISFTFQHNGKTYFKTPGSGRLHETVAALWGKDFLDCFLPVEWAGERIRLSGMISRPEYKRGNRQRQIFFVNGRIVQNPMLTRAVDEGYRGLLISKEFPAVILFLEVVEEDVDCNVHPQKLQVRFRDEGSVFQVVMHTLREHLAQLNHQISFAAFAERAKPEEKPRPTAFYTQNEYDWAPRANHSVNLFPERSLKVEEEVQRYEPYPPVGPGLESWEMPETEPPDYAREPFRIIGQAFQGYILVEVQEKLWIVDQHAAHERINYNLIRRKLQENQSLTQMLVIPQVLEVSLRDMELFREKETELRRLGFVLESLGEHELILRGVPETCVDAWENAPNTLEALNDISSAVSLEKMAARLACKKSVKDHQTLDKAEMEKLIARLLTEEDFRHCPHGRPTFVEISHEELEKKFKRT